MYKWVRGALVCMLLFTTGRATAQDPMLSLSEALERAEQSGPGVQAAALRAIAAEQAAIAASSHRFPMLGADAGGIRSNDPVAAFGGRLRQGRFTQADFDPARLNDPDALMDWSAGIGVSWTPFDFQGRARAAAANAEADAALLGAEWGRRAAQFAAEASYLSAVAASELQASAAAAREAAAASLDRIRSRRNQGLLTDADVLQAEAALAGARAGEIDAERRLNDARQRLGTVLGMDPVVLPSPTAQSLEEVPGSSSAGSRADLRAGARGVDAALARYDRARAARLPTIETFARVDTHMDGGLSALEGSHTIGARVSIPLFTGFALGAGRKAAQAAAQAAREEHQRRLREAGAELSTARRAVPSAREMLEATRSASQAADEAARLQARRFGEGLATTADLLAAEAAAAERRAAVTSALLFLRLSEARVHFLTDNELIESLSQ